VGSGDEVDLGRFCSPAGEEGAHIGGEFIDIDSHVDRSLCPGRAQIIQPFFRLPERALVVAHAAVEVRGRDLDEPLHEAGLHARWLGAPPEAFQRLMGLPEVGVIVEIDSVKIAIENSPLIGIPGWLDFFRLAIPMPLGVRAWMRISPRHVAVRRERDFGPARPAWRRRLKLLYHDTRLKLRYHREPRFSFILTSLFTAASWWPAAADGGSPARRRRRA
jgi:hypothetical protein